jgi:hypothetical protein
MVGCFFLARQSSFHIGIIKIYIVKKWCNQKIPFDDAPSTKALTWGGSHMLCPHQIHLPFKGSEGEVPTCPPYPVAG